MMRLLLIFFLFPIISFSQVSNDSIAHRKHLLKGIPNSSSTSNCTVEGKCVDESLTGKCIEYHNDQWFSYYSKQKEKLFVNVSRQQCKDLLGVQLVVIKGIPCQVSTYEIKACISLKSQDDFYVEVPFDKETEYLLNIDGYLNDFCGFQISIDTFSKGFPVESNLPMETKSEQQKSIVKIKWNLPDSLETQISHFEIFERKDKEFKHKLADSIPLQRGSHHGYSNGEYIFIDTLNDIDKHYYKLIAVNIDGQKMLIKEYEFRYKPYDRVLVKLKLDYKNKTPLTMIIWDEHHSSVLQRTDFKFDKKKYSDLYIDATYWKENGVKGVIVEIINEDAKQKKIEKHQL